MKSTKSFSVMLILSNATYMEFSNIVAKGKAEAMKIAKSELSQKRLNKNIQIVGNTIIPL